MALEYLSGIENDDTFVFEYDTNEVLSSVGSRASRRAFWNRAKKKLSTKKPIFKKGAVKKFFKKAGKIFVKVSAAPARGAFLALLNVNALQLGAKLYAAYRANPGKVTSFWTKAGGKPNALIKSMKHGYNKKAKKDGKAQISGCNDDGDATVGIALEAAIAMATPLIIAATGLIKSIKPQTPAPSPQEQAMIEQGAQDYNDAIIQQGTENGNLIPGGTINFFKSYKIPLMIGGGLLVAGIIYLAVRKKAA